ncbi:hypothetical protein OH686_12050 [Pseudomonas sp. SO81]|nr:hypothetical protein OH686_12050 [Pseudomonas sp. SO81]
MGTMISAIRADRRLLMIRYMKVMTMAKPRKVSMAISGRAHGGVAARPRAGGGEAWRAPILLLSGHRSGDDGGRMLGGEAFRQLSAC